jgi:hypothetical protein
MATVNQVIVPTFSIDGLTTNEVALILSALAIAPTSKIKTNLFGNNVSLTLKQVGDMQTKLWEEIQ